MRLWALFPASAAVVVLSPAFAQENAAFWTLQGDNALTQREYGKAEMAYQKAVALNPSTSEAHRKLAYALTMEADTGPLVSMRNLPRIRRAEGELERAVELSSGDALALINLARLHDGVSRCARTPEERETERNRALETARQAVAAQPAAAGLHYYLANIETFAIWSAIHQAQLETGIGANDPLFFADSKLRSDLRAHYGPALEEAIEESRKAWDLEPRSALAGLQLLVLLSARASIRDTQAEFATDAQTIAALEQEYRRRVGTDCAGEKTAGLMQRLMSPAVPLLPEVAGMSGSVPPH